MSEEKLLFKTNDIFEANIIKSKLEAEGIPVLVKGDILGNAYKVTVNGLGLIRIYVGEENLEKAKELIDTGGGSEDSDNKR